MVGLLDDFFLDQVAQHAEVDDVAGDGVDGSFDRDFERVVVAVPVRIVAFSVQTNILFGRDVLQVQNGQLVEREVPMLNALNEVLRDDYIKDSVSGVGRWNKVIEKAGIPFRLTTPHKAFHRNIGALAGVKVAPDGRLVSEAEWKAKVDEWLPSAADRAYVAGLMGRVVEPGKFANWIAPPVMGINRQPVNFDYVRFN